MIRRNLRQNKTETGDESEWDCLCDKKDEQEMNKEINARINKNWKYGQVLIM